MPTIAELISALDQIAPPWMAGPRLLASCLSYSSFLGSLTCLRRDTILPAFLYSLCDKSLCPLMRDIFLLTGQGR